MSWVFRTMIVPAALAPLARGLAAGLSPAGVGMFEVPVSSSGTEPATHYISTGQIDSDFAEVVVDADALFAACQAAGAAVTLPQCQALVALSDVTADEPHGVLTRLGLQLVEISDGA